MLALAFDEILDQQIYDEGIVLEEIPFKHTDADGLYYRSARLDCPVIIVNRDLETTYEKNYVKVHELGHHHKCGQNLFDSPSWLREKHEMLADRDWVDRIMSIDNLIKAYELGNNTPMALADYLQIPLDALVKGIHICYQKYGLATQHGQYCIYWDPFNIKKDKRRKKL